MKSGQEPGTTHDMDDDDFDYNDETGETSSDHSNWHTADTGHTTEEREIVK